MKVTFPHMGNIYVTAKVIFDRLDIDYVMPTLRNRDALEKASAIAPESICLPFKIILGNLMEGLDNGADTVMFGGGHGRCRLSYFGDLIKETLEAQGYSFHYLFLDFNHFDFKEFTETFSPLVQGVGKIQITRGLLEGLHTAFAVDHLYSLSCRIRCREVHRGDTDAVMQRFEKAILCAQNAGLILAEMREAKRDLRAIPLKKDFKPLRVMLVGEIFSACEPFVNLEIERKLGNMGVDVYNMLGIGSWIRNRFLGSVFPFIARDDPIKAAQHFFGTDDFGGLGMDTVGNSSLARKQGMDGVIQIYPMNCMPEIVAETAMPFVQKEEKLPIMSLVVDEMTGEAGYVTRLEAFTDMLEMRRGAKVISR
ncbi:MAG TPA: hypothetical protein DEP42_06700 [Ruminococcaceae bacterium]|nr:hypothetical protein [Oscillospiraceae bacterium]